MAHRKITLRRMPPTARKFAKLLGELDGIIRRGKNMEPEIASLELDSRALANIKGNPAAEPVPLHCPDCETDNKVF